MLRKPTGVKDAAGGSSALAGTPSTTSTNSNSNKSLSRARLSLLLALLIGLLLFVHNRLSSSRQQQPATAPPEVAVVEVPSQQQQLRTLPPPPPPPSAPVAADMNNCHVIKRLLSGEIPSSTEGLPQAGKPNEFGLVFWLKTPVLHATLEIGQDEQHVVLLKYNKYLPTQHHLKYGNTVSILSEFGTSSSLFPRMFAHCDDAGDGFHYILVEYLSLHPSELPKPGSFAECTARAKSAVQMFVTLDEDMHLAFMDVKKGQWMARSDGGGSPFVLQDVDDIVRTPWRPTNAQGDLYTDQVQVAKQRVQDLLPRGTSAGYVDRLWDEEIFPHGYSIRYAMILLNFVLEDDLGFRWRDECPGMPPTYRACFRRVLDWAATPGEDWPAPRQVLTALEQCELRGEFERTAREPAAWRDQSAFAAAAVSTNDDKKPPPHKKPKRTYISCMRARDSRKKTDADYTEHVQWCTQEEEGTRGVPSNSSSSSCCRAKNAQEPCYYLVAKPELCGGGGSGLSVVS